MFDVKKNSTQKVVIYRGNWRDDKFHGTGVLFNLDGLVRRGVKIDIGDFDKLSKN